MNLCNSSFNKNQVMENKIHRAYVGLEIVIVCALFSVILFLNFYKLTNNVNTDYIAELNFGRLMWDKKSIFPESWIYANEYMFFRPATLYALIYGITGEYLLSASIVLSFLAFLIVAAFLYLCGGTQSKISSILLGIITLLSMGGEGRSFAVLTYLFYGYYAYYLVAVLFSVGVLERVNDNPSKKPVPVLLCIVIAVVLGVVGIRMTVFLYAPILFISLAAATGRGPVRNKECRRFGIILFLCNIAGVCFGKVLFPNEQVVGDVLNVSLIDFSNFFSRLWKNTVASIQMLIGTSGGMKVLSVSTFDCLCKFFLFSITIYILMRERKEFSKRYGVAFFFYYWLTVLGTTTLTNYGEGVSFYYFLLPCFVAYLVAMISNSCSQIKCTLVLACLAIAISVTNFCIYYYPYMQSQRNTEVDSLVTFLEENNIHHVLMSFWQAGPVEAYSNGKITTAFMTPYCENGMEPFIYLNRRENYDNVTIAVLTDDEEAKILMDEGSKLYSERNEKIGEVGSYNIYEFESTPFFLKRLPNKGETIEYKMENMMLINGACIDDDGNALSSGSEGYFVTGPYIAAEDGEYDVAFFYSVADKTSSNTIGSVDVSADSGEKILSEEKILPGTGEITLERINLSGEENVEFRVFAYEENIIKVEKILLTRVG